MARETGGGGGSQREGEGEDSQGHRKTKTETQKEIQAERQRGERAVKEEFARDKEGIIYTGLGYSIHYYRRKTNSMGGYGVVYKLFNISLWGWEAT